MKTIPRSFTTLASGLRFALLAPARLALRAAAGRLLGQHPLKYVQVSGFLFALLSIALVLGAASSAHATAYYWDTASGNWNVNTNWSNNATFGNSTNTGTFPNSVSSDSATFNQTGLNNAETIYLNGNQTVGTLTINNTATTTLLGGDYNGGTPIAGNNTLTLGTSGITVANGAGTVTIGGSTKVDLVINANQTFSNLNANSTNLLVINNGISAVAGGGLKTINLAGTSTANQGNMVFNGVISKGSGSDDIAFATSANGAGTYTFNSTNTFAGGLSNGSGGATFVVGANNALGTGTFTVGGGGAGTTLKSTGDYSLANNIQNTNTGQVFSVVGLNSITFNGSYTQTTGAKLTSSISFGKNLTLNGTFGLSSTDVTGTTSGLGGTGNTVINGNVVNNMVGNTQAQTFFLSNTGTTTIAGSANTYSGGLNFTGIGLNINSATALGATAGTFTINNANAVIDNTSGGTITNSNNNAITISLNFTFGGTNDLNLGTGTASMNWNTTNSNTITLNGVGRTLTLGGQFNQTSDTSKTFTVNGAGNTLVLGALALNTASSATVQTQSIAGNGNVTISGAVSKGGAGAGAQSLSYTGTGTLTLNGNNSYDGLTTMNNALGTLTLAGDNSSAAGGVTITAGTLNINNVKALGSGTLTIGSTNFGGIINNTSAGVVTVSTNNAITFANNLTFIGTKDLNLGTGTVTLGAPRTVTVNGGTLTFGGGVTNAGNTLTKAGAGTLAFTGVIGNGAGGVTVSAGTLNLSGLNTYNGTTTVNGGNLLVDFSSNASPLSAINIINNAANNSALALGGGTLTVKGGGSTATNTQRFNGLTLTANTQSELAVNVNSATSVGVTLGAIGTFTTGSSVDFTLPTNSSLSTNSTTFAIGTNNILASSATANGQVAFATASGGTTWATNTTGTIGALATGSYATGGGNYSILNDIDVGTSDAPTANVTVNTLRFNTAGATLTMAGTDVVKSGGILVTSNETAANGGATITGASGSILTPGNTAAGKELLIINNGYLTVGSNVNMDQAASSSSTLTIASTTGQSGTTIINGLIGNASGLNTLGIVITNPGTTIFNGNIRNNSGGVTATAGSNYFNGSSINFGSGGITVSGGSTIFSTGVTTSAGTPVTVSGGALALNAANTFSAGTSTASLSNNGALRLGNASSLLSTSAVTMGNTSQLILAADSAIGGTGFALTQSTQGGWGTVYLDRASGGAALITQQVSSLSLSQVGSLYTFAGGNVNSSTPKLTVTGTTGYGNGNGTKGSLIAPYGVNLALGAVINNPINGGGGTGGIFKLDGNSTGNTISGIIQDNATPALGAGAIDKTNISTWTLSGANTFTGTLNIYGGTLCLDFNAAGAPSTNIIPSGKILGALNGTLLVNGSSTGANSQTLGAITVPTNSASTIKVVNNGKDIVLNLGAINAGGGAALIDFVLPTGGQTSTNGITTTQTNINGILAFAATNNATTTVNGGADFATNSSNATGGNIVAYSSYAPVFGAGSASTVASQSGSLNLTATFNFYGLKLTDTGAGQSIDLKGFGLGTGATRGMALYAGGTSNSLEIRDTVGGGSYGSYPATGNGFYQSVSSGATLTVSAQLMPAASGGYVAKSGDGTMIVSSAANSYTGGTFILGGVLSIASLGADGQGPSSIGTGGITINGGTLKYTGGQVVTARSLSFGGNGNTLDASGNGAVTFVAAPAFANNGNGGVQLTLAGTNTDANTFAGQLTNPTSSNHGLPLFSLVKNGTGKWVLTGANTYTGPTTINDGTLAISGAGTFGGYSASTPTPFTVNGGTADFGGTTNSLFGQVNLGTTSTSGTIQNGTVTSIDGFFVNQGTVSANLAGTSTFAGLTKNTANTVTLSGTNTYTGATTIGAGTLQFAKQNSLYNNGAAAAWSNSNIIVQSGATLALNVGGAGGFSSANITNLSSLGNATGGFKSGSTLALDTTNAGGDFTHAVAIVNPNGGANVLGLTKLGTGNLTLTAANTFTGNTTVTTGTLIISGGGALTQTGNVVVTSGGSLLIGASNVINDNAKVAMSGGTISMNGAYSETLGALTLSANSTLDFGASNSIFKFLDASSGFHPAVFTLTVMNWTPSKQLTFTGDQQTNIDAGAFSFTGFGSISQNDNLDGTFTIIAVPEPTTIMTGGFLLCMLAFFERRRLRKLLGRA